MLSTAFVALTAVAFAAPAAAQTYDAFGGFTGNNVQNGGSANNGANNGNFIYGTVNQTTPASGSFFGVNTGCVIPGSICLQQSDNGNPGSLPGVYKSTATSTFLTVAVPNDRLLAHPGNNSDLTAILFVAPTAGIYRLTASFNTQDSNPTGISIFGLGTSGGAGPFTFNQFTTNSFAPFSNTQIVTLAASEAVGYGIGNGGNYSNDSTGVKFSVIAVPEPASWALMILGLGAVGFAMRRRTRTTVSYA